MAESTIRGGKGTKDTVVAGGEGSPDWADTVYTISTLGADERRRAVGGGGLHLFWTTGRTGETVDERGTPNVSIAVRVDGQ